MAARDPGGEKRASGSQDFARSFFFRVTHKRLSERGTTRSLNCTALANCPRYSIEMNQYPHRVHQLAYCLEKISEKFPKNHLNVFYFSVYNTPILNRLSHKFQNFLAVEEKEED